eukprot:gene6337-8568_t
MPGLARFDAAMVGSMRGPCPALRRAVKSAARYREGWRTLLDRDAINANARALRGDRRGQSWASAAAWRSPSPPSQKERTEPSREATVQQVAICFANRYNSIILSRFLQRVAIVVPCTFLAIDWGTTSRRCYRIDRHGKVEQLELKGNGVRAVTPDGFAAEIAALRSAYGDLPMLLAGMVGSNLGWIDVPYVSAPCGIEDLAARAHWVEPGRTAIMPGVCATISGRADLMCGEEIQFFGA